MSTTTSEDIRLDTNTTYTTRTYPLSEEACLAAGGHCYEQDTTWYLGGTPVGVAAPGHSRTCKHCGKKQAGTPQQDIRWEDA